MASGRVKPERFLSLGVVLLITLFTVGLVSVICLTRETQPAKEAIAEFYDWPNDVVPNPVVGKVRTNPEIANGLKTLFRTSSSERDRYAAYYLLAQSRVPGFEEIILLGVEDRAERIRARAVYDLRDSFPCDAMVPECIRLLGDTSSHVRYNAAEALMRCPSERAMKPLIVLLGDESIEIRHRAASTLVRWDLPVVWDELRALSRSSDPRVAGVANCALMFADSSPPSLEAVHSYLSHELEDLSVPPYHGTDIVVSIIRELGDYQDRSSLPVLRKATSHSHRSVREEADQAVARFGEGQTEHEIR